MVVAGRPRPRTGRHCAVHHVVQVGGAWLCGAVFAPAVRTLDVEVLEGEEVVVAEFAPPCVRHCIVLRFEVSDAVLFTVAADLIA